MIQEKLWQNLDDRESEAISGGQIVSLVLLFVNNSRSNTSSNAVTSEMSFFDRVPLTFPSGDPTIRRL